MRRPKKAIALAVALTFMTALMIGGVPQMQRSISNNQAVYREYSQEKAFWLAEAGLHEARYAIANDTLDSDWHNAGNVYTKIGVSGDGLYTATVTVTGSDYAISSSSSIAAFGNSNAYSKQLSLEATKTSASTAGTKVFKHAVFLDGDIDMSAGGRIYGDVGAMGDVTLGWDAKIDGNIHTSSSSDISIPQDCSNKWWKPAECSIVDDASKDLKAEDKPAEATVPSYLTALASSGSFTTPITGTVTRTGGKRRYSSITVGGDCKLQFSSDLEMLVDGNITVNGDAKIKFAGTAVVYFKGNLQIAASGSSSGNLADVIFIGIGDETQTVSITGDGASTGGIYAPNANVVINGSSAFQGAIVAKNITLSGTASLTYVSDMGDASVSTGTTTSTETEASFSNWSES